MKFDHLVVNKILGGHRLNGVRLIARILEGALNLQMFEIIDLINISSLKAVILLERLLQFMRWLKI